MKTFSILMTFATLLGGLGNTHAAWTKFAGPDSIRVLFSGFVDQIDVGGDEVYFAKRDSFYTTGMARAVVGLNGDEASAFAVIANYFGFAGTKQGSIYRKLIWNSVYDWSFRYTLPGNPKINSISRYGYESSLIMGTSKGVFLGGFGDGQTTVATALNNGLPNAPVTALVVYGTFVLAGTDSGVYTLLNGSSWVKKGVVSGTATIHVITGPSDRLFAATDSGVFRSLDSGANWTAFNKGLPKIGANGFVYGVPNSAVSTDGGVYRSSSDSASWTIMDSGFPPGRTYALAGSSYRIYAATDLGLWAQYFPDIPRPASISRDGKMIVGYFDSHSLSFTLEKSGRVALEVYSVLGKPMGTLIDASFSAGTHNSVLPVKKLRVGVYVFRLRTNAGVVSRLISITN